MVLVQLLKEKDIEWHGWGSQKRTKVIVGNWEERDPSPLLWMPGPYDFTRKTMEVLNLSIYLSISFFFVIFTFIIGMHCSLVLNKSFKVQTHTHILESLCPFLCLSILSHYSLVGLKMDSYLNKMTTLPFLKAHLFFFLQITRNLSFLSIMCFDKFGLFWVH